MKVELFNIKKKHKVLMWHVAEWLQLKMNARISVYLDPFDFRAAFIEISEGLASLGKREKINSSAKPQTILLASVRANQEQFRHTY